MEELLQNALSLASLGLVITIIAWRFWSKLGLIILIVLTIGFTYFDIIEMPLFRTNSASEQRREEIIAFSHMSIDSMAGIMHSRHWEGKEDGDALIYPADMQKDYYKFYRSEPGRFLVAFDNESEYEDFFQSIDSLKVNISAKECPNGKVYQLQEKCYACKTGYKIIFKRFILMISRSEDFTLPIAKFKKEYKSKTPSRKKPMEQYHPRALPPPPPPYKPKKKLDTLSLG